MSSVNVRHGGDWTGFQAEQGCMPLDFSVNLSPLGTPDGVRRVLRDAADRAECYPDPLCRRLCAAIAVREGVPPEWVLCGNGAAELIFRAAFASHPAQALITAPAFSEYEAALLAAGCKRLIRYPLRAEENFRLHENILNAISPDMDLIFLCQPNNPTGMTISPPLLRRILERCQAAGSRLILDECFLDFLDQPNAYTCKEALSVFSGLLILRSFTKLYAIPGARLGFALCADGVFLDQMRQCGPPWSVSQFAQEAGLAALQEIDYVHVVRTYVAMARPRLFRALCALGLRVIPGEANFLLFQSPVLLDQPLRQRNILIRVCRDYAGLDHTWYRVAVRTENENRRLIAALREVLLSK